jgi:hypothetical protein
LLLATAAAADAIRPFILHAVGGVYLDLDSECFSSMQPWLDGPQLVLQAEVRMLHHIALRYIAYVLHSTRSANPNQEPTGTTRRRLLVWCDADKACAICGRLCASAAWSHG